MTDETYEGWTNRETWYVSLWLNNEEPLYDAAREIAARGERSFDAAETLRQYVEELVLGDEPPANLATDLLTYALARVNYREIVESFRED